MRVSFFLTAVASGCAWAASVTSPHVAGWRTDTSGCYPEATPPLRWAPDKNVAWVTPMPGRSSATPIIVGQEIFVASDPSVLLCVNKADGKVVWQRENDIEKVAPAADTENWRKRQEQARELQVKVARLISQRDPLAEEAKSKPSDQELKARVAELSKQITELDKQRAMLGKDKAVKPNGAVGQSCCTPVSDGSVLAALYNSGVLVCYDLEGKLRWARFLRPVCKGYGQSMSPALAGGVLGVHIDDAMFGVDLRTGRTLWEDYELQHQGSPVGLRVGELDLFLTCEGHVRRAADGKILTKIGGALNLFTTPAFYGETGYWIAENRRLSVCQFLPKSQDGIEVKGGGRGAPKGVYYASVLKHDGCLYLYNHSPRAPDSDPKRKMPRTLHVLDGQTGKPLADLPLSLGGNAYPSPTAAGKFVFVAGDNGKCLVLAPMWRIVETGPGAARKDFVLKEVATNILEPHNACPVFEGDRMYVRGQKNLYCIAASDEDKKEAKTLFEEQPNPVKQPVR